MIPLTLHRMTANNGSRSDAGARGMLENDIGTIVVRTATEIHRALGPGLLESVYEVVLSHQLTRQGLRVDRQVPIPISFRNLRFEEGFRADIVIERQVVLELKAIEILSRAHIKQLQTYLKLTGCKLGYVLNFSAALMKEGIVRVVNGLTDSDDPASQRRSATLFYRKGFL